MLKIFLSLFIFCLIGTNAFAYLGPGVGFGVIAATLGVIVAILAALISTLILFLAVVGIIVALII